MSSIARTVVREPATATAGEYSRRVYVLALIYAALFLSSVGGIVLIIWQARLFVTLTQRTNVETLVLAFFLIFYG